MKTTTILATCYAVNPYKGSEDAMGWNFVCQIAKFRKVIAITRENNRSSIEKYMKENPDEIFENIQFLYFDLPYWARFWKKGSRGAMVYFYLWQRNIIGFIKSKQLDFDIVHNLNFHNDWTPTFLWKLHKPLVWGPVGHHPKIPRQYLRFYSFRTLLNDRLKWLVKKISWKFSPALKNSVKNANHIWCMNSSVSESLPLNKSHYSIYPSVATEDFFEGFKPKKSFQILSVGRFVPLKGFDLTINAFADFLKHIPEKNRASCRLTLVGTGPEKKLYQQLISKHHIEPYVQIIEWIDRKDLMNIYKESSAFLFPSHEGAGMVVAEALSFGLPVIALNNVGPGEYIHSKFGFTVSQNSYNTTVDSLCHNLLKLFLDPSLTEKMSREARKYYEEKFSWDKRGDYLNTIYQNFEP